MLASGAKVILAIYYDYPPTGDEYKSLKICASVVGFFVFFIFFRDHKDGWRHEIWIGSMVVVFNLLFLAVVKIAKEYRNSAIDLPRTPLKMIFGHWPDNGLEADKPPTWEHERVIDEWRVRQQKEFQENLERRKSTQ